MKKNKINEFTSIIGDCPKSRVLSFLIEGRGMDFSMTDITEGADIGWTTFNRIWPMIIKQNLVIETRKIGKARLFKINETNIIVKKLIELFDTIIYESDFFKKVPCIGVASVEQIGRMVRKGMKK